MEQILILSVIFLFIYTAYVFIRDKKEGLSLTEFTCSQGEFEIRGTKDDFVIEKNGRYEFTVKNGQIVSVLDRGYSSEPYQYGGD